ncbi:hypothetical protein [Roseomonas sp. 18066]|uniref:hypothetical protein n=1 Tax=Roseomonas sp. 18066 TaxID=2681412 RepID=UPI00135C1990|nr:hypothetical protein [Roseomonas sp. 18066]
MASAMTPPPLRAGGALATPLSHWAAWSVRYRCADPGCQPGLPLPVAGLLAERGALSLRAFAGSLRCAGCGQAAADVSLRRACPGGEVIQPVQGCALS